jgi:hypothetical protein
MKFIACIARPLAAFALVSTALPQTAPDPATPVATSPTTSSTLSTAAPTPTDRPRGAEATSFTTFEGASPAVRTAVANAQAVAQTIRSGTSSASSSIVSPDLSRAVAQASAAIVQEGRVARSEILAQRQASLTRLRLAQSEADRQRLIDELRVQNGQRMEQQREVARQVRDRLRELRATTTIAPRPGN